MERRAYSILHIKAVDDERRHIEGMASTPETDRMGDVVEPLGAQFKGVLSLLLHHDSTQPVGWVKFGKPTKDGLPFSADFLDPDEPRSATLRERVLEAWDSVRLKLIRGVSIGFRVLEDGIEPLKNGGVRFTKYEVLELSLVSIPANASASISVIRSFDAAHLAASGTAPGTSRHTSGASDARVVSLTKSTRGDSMTNQEKRIAFEADKAGKVAKMNALMGEGDGSTFDAAQQEEFDGLASEIKSIDGHLARIETMEQINRTAATVVDGGSVAKASESRGGQQHVITVRDNVPPGIGFARSVMCQVHARLDGHNVLDVAKARYPDHSALHNYLTIKATVPAGTTTQAVYAAPLVYAQNLASEFVEFLQPQTILGKFGTGGVPSLTRVPFNVRVPSQTSDGNAEWVAPGAGKPVTSAAFGTVTLTYHKVATIAVLTKELVRLSTPSAELLVRNMLANAIIRKLDDSFIDPSFAAVTGTNPASITNGLVAQSSAGPSADNARTDLGNILQAYLEANQDPTGLVLIMPPTLAMVLSLMRNSLGQKEFQDINSNGGTLEGFPVITSQHAANSSGAGNIVVAVKASDIFLADDGVVTIDASEQASVQMSDTPTINSTTGTGASLVSLWQTNSVGIRAEREITWTKARSTAVVYMDDVNWGSVGSPA